MSALAEMPAGDQLGPLFENWIVFYDDAHNPPDDSVVEKACVCGLSDGRVLIRKLTPSSREGLRNLLSNSRAEPTLYDVSLEWAARVRSYMPASIVDELKRLMHSSDAYRRAGATGGLRAALFRLRSYLGNNPPPIALVWLARPFFAPQPGRARLPPRRAPARVGAFFGRFAVSGRPCSKRSAPAHAFISHQTDGFGADLSYVEFRLAMSNPHDDFCSLRPVGVYPQIKIGNDLVEYLKEKRNRLRIEGSVVMQHPLQWQRELPGCGGACSVAIVYRARARLQGRSLLTPLRASRIGPIEGDGPRWYRPLATKGRTLQCRKPRSRSCWQGSFLPRWDPQAPRRCRLFRSRKAWSAILAATLSTSDGGVAGATAGAGRAAPGAGVIAGAAFAAGSRERRRNAKLHAAVLGMPGQRRLWFWTPSDARCADEFLALAIAHKAEPREAKGIIAQVEGSRDFPDDQREVLVCPVPHVHT